MLSEELQWNFFLTFSHVSLVRDHVSCINELKIDVFEYVIRLTERLSIYKSMEWRKYWKGEKLEKWRQQGEMNSPKFIVISVLKWFHYQLNIQFDQVGLTNQRNILIISINSDTLALNLEKFGLIHHH